MGELRLLLKRPTLLCAFLVCGCAEQTADISQSNKVYEEASSSYTRADAQNTPLLSLAELLNASDVKQALAEAAANNDEEGLRIWQQTLLAAGEEVELTDNELALISGKQGLKYLAFVGMKINYQTAFERAFLEFEDVDKVYADYPAFEDLHKQSIKLVKQRDELVRKVTEELESSGYEGNAELEARRQWKNFVLAENALETQMP